MLWSCITPYKERQAPLLSSTQEATVLPNWETVVQVIWKVIFCEQLYGGRRTEWMRVVGKAENYVSDKDGVCVCVCFWKQ